MNTAISVDSAGGPVGGAVYVYSYFKSKENGYFEISNKTLLYEDTTYGSKYGASVAIFEGSYELNNSEYLNTTLGNNTASVIICVGAPGDHYNGRVFVYYSSDVLIGTEWTLEQILKSPMHITRFGSSLSLYQDVLVRSCITNCAFYNYFLFVF